MGLLPSSLQGGSLEMARKVNRNILFLSCIGILLLISPSTYAVRQKGKNGLETSLSAEPADSGTADQSFECTDTPADHSLPVNETTAVKKFTAILSQEKQKVSLTCGKALTVIPTNLAGGMVCPAGLEDLTTCKESSSDALEKKSPPEAAATAPESLSVLMGGPSTSPVKWQETDVQGGTEGKSYTLSLPPVPLPLLDSAFQAGCEKEKTKCVLTVTVEARKSVASGQTASCAYGAKSNPTDKRPTVVITPEKNTMTLVCGTTSSTTIPANISESYCTGASSDCTTKEQYTSVIPGFQAGWWVDGKDGSWTLTIPKDQVPTSPKTIHVGCQYKVTAPQVPGSTKTASTGPTACMVDVVFGGSEGSSATRPTVATALTLTLAVTLGFSFAKLS
ncbi:srs domain-containing protein [Cystoisospora suis]|uniref:Srs domain-containing protein n=1 Tax=Cystoisospora suis TaxID=483139 RepID=A0A2C6KFU5_9APIC|nr:srs domain-containing protein [Cystoisospora suis]